MSSATLSKKSASRIKIGAIVIATIILAILLLYPLTLRGYRAEGFFKSELSGPLSAFVYNQSKHTDPVRDCWYDSGDYIVFLHRNTESLFYLSEAYQSAINQDVKSDLFQVIDQQLTCVEEMISKNYKQFRDQDNHGRNIPPKLNQIYYPQQDYTLEEAEGKDVFLMLSLIYKNLGNNDRSAAMLRLAEDHPEPMVSANCCEEGPLVNSEQVINSLEGLLGKANVQSEGMWGINFSSLLAIDNNEWNKIKGTLQAVDRDFSDTGHPFNYIGGNYDIAGSIALERIYAEKTGDQSLKDLSDKLYKYLHGENKFNVDFANFDEPYHPCGFFNICNFNEILINGIDETEEFNLDRSDPWRIAEMQLVGQAKYVLAYILYHEL